MAYNFMPCDRNQAYLLPPSLTDWLPQDHPMLFLETLHLCAEAGLVKLGKVSLDGTKIKANASLSANRTLKHLEQEIDKMLSEAVAKAIWN